LIRIATSRLIDMARAMSTKNSITPSGPIPLCAMNFPTLVAKDGTFSSSQMNTLRAASTTSQIAR
jgi:hypothetical protein